ncbi:hypothetical protein OEZ86_010822 [Tetradesmus obliquus]|nr:hypothetical protein OEZ86_010822 [Tetradesmus obliquus]
MQPVLFSLLVLLAAGPQLQAAAASSDPTAQLEAAARSNDVAAAQQAIQDGADVNAQGGGGQTPIMAATLSGSTDIVRFLLDEHSSRVDTSIGEKDGYTPMHGAGFQGRADIARLLIAAGLNPSDRHRDGFTPIHRACWGRQQRHTDTVRVLLEDGKVDVNELANGNTPLDSALGSGNEATVALIRSKGGRTAGDIAMDREL